MPPPLLVGAARPCRSARDRPSVRSWKIRFDLVELLPCQHENFAHGYLHEYSEIICRLLRELQKLMGPEPSEIPECRSSDQQRILGRYIAQGDLRGPRTRPR